mmetsp:Transcript_4347/g.9534  ORF Transcript_4347/g.9534 Transcript_4347/m.9534 type:complete len:227 (-) Transcript_4347:475-1155(-)
MESATLPIVKLTAVEDPSAAVKALAINISITTANLPEESVACSFSPLLARISLTTDSGSLPFPGFLPVHVEDVAASHTATGNLVPASISRFPSASRLCRQKNDPVAHPVRFSHMVAFAAHTPSICAHACMPAGQPSQDMSFAHPFLFTAHVSPSGQRVCLAPDVHWVPVGQEATAVWHDQSERQRRGFAAGQSRLTVGHGVSSGTHVPPLSQKCLPVSHALSRLLL